MSSTSLGAQAQLRVRHPPSRRLPRLGPLARHAILALFMLVILLPIGWVGLMSISDRRAVIRSALWPGVFDPSSYGSMLRLGSALGGNIANSVLVTAGTVLLTTVCAVTGGYALVFVRTRGRWLVVAALVASLFVPTKIVSVVAVWQIQHALGLLNTTWGLLLPYSTLALALGVLIMRAVFQGLSAEMVEAAWIDGAGPVRTLWSVLLPSARNGIVLVIVASFIAAWGEYLLAARLIDDRSARTLPVVLGVAGGIVQPRSAALWIVSIIPAVLIALFAQRFVSRGLQEGLGR